MRLGIEVTDLDPEAKQVLTSGGQKINYDHLLIATGSTPR